MRTIIVTTLLLATAACKPALLPGTEIEESADTRAIYDTLESYRQAMEDRSPDRVLNLVATDYFETGGTEDPSDDYGYEEFSQHIRDDLSRTLALRLELRLKDIVVDGDAATVEYRFRTRAHIRFPAGDKWISSNDVNEMHLKRVGDSWKISAGL